MEQAEAWVEAVVAEAKEVVVAGAKAAVAEAWEEVLRQDRVDIVSVPTAVKEQPINWGAPVMGSNVLSAERL